MRTSPATLSDVAARAGVDSSTASRVLNGQAGHRVAAGTRERILQAASELDYRPNAMARSLRTARTQTLGIVVPLLDSPVFTGLIESAQRAARGLGYSLLIAHIEENSAGGETYERLAQTHQLDGLLVSTLDEDSVTVQAVKRARLPFVILNRQVAGVPCCISFDMRRAARLAVEHLIALGHRRIAHLAANPSTSSGTRLEGWREAMAEAGLPADASLLAQSGYTVAGGARAMRELLQREGPRPTAVFPLTLAAAVGAVIELRRSGIAVPGQMSVATIHDASMAEMVFPELTTVRMPVEEMGRLGAARLVDAIASGSMGEGAVLDPLELVVRGSTAAPPG